MRPKLSTTIAAILAVSVLAGCSRIETGDVGIVRHFDGKIDQEAAPPGMYLAVLDSYQSIDTTQTRITVKGLMPKDASGVALKDVDVVVTFSLCSSRVSGFYTATKEIDTEEDESSRQTLGLKVLGHSVIPNVVQEATEKSSLTAIASSLAGYQNAIQAGITARLNALYPNTNPFVIRSVSVLNFALPDAMQAQVNARAGYQSALQTVAAQIAVVQKRKDLLQLQATVDANALAQATKATGLTVDQIIAWKRAEAYATMASNIRGAAIVSIPSQK